MAGNGQAAPAGSGRGLALTFVEGRAVLAVEGRTLAPLGRADRLELEVPSLRFPFDVSGGVSRFQSRRCRLRDLHLSAGRGEVAGFLRGGRLRDFGIAEPSVSVTGSELRIEARARLGRHEAGFTVRGALRAIPPRRARISLYDVRVYGFLPLSAPMLASALFTPCGASAPRPTEDRRTSGAVPAAAPLMWLDGPSDLELELLELALLGLLPGQGWRMPERGQVQAVLADGDGGRLALRYAWRDSPEASGVPDPLAAYDQSRRRHGAAEEALGRGEIGAAADAYRRAGPVGAGDPWAAARLLQLLSAGASTLEEAAALAGEALARWPGFVPALLAQATAASEGGQPAEAAALYQQVADLSARLTPLDHASALVAVARERQRAAEGAAALAALERAVAVSPAHGGACRALAQRLTGDGRWSDLLRVILQRAVDEEDAAAKAALYAEAGFVYLDRLGDRERARDRFEQAARLAPDEPAGWEGLGRLEGDGGPQLERALAIYTARGERGGQARVQVALAGLDQAASDQDSALRRLEEAATLDEDAPEPLRRAGEIAMARGDHPQARRLLQRALVRSTGRPEQGPERAAIVRVLAGLLGGPLGQPIAARMLLEEALGEHPCDFALLDQLGALLLRTGARAEWEPFLRRCLEQARQAGQRRMALVRLGDLARERGDDARLAEMLALIVESGGPEAIHAGVELAVLAQAGSEAPLLARAAEVIAALLSAPEGEKIPADRRAELAWRLAGVFELRRDEDGALQWLRASLEGGADGLVAVAAWRRFVEIAARRGDASAAARGLIAWADDQRTGETEREQAGHLVAAAEIFRERLGLVADAVALLERAMGLDPLNDSAFATLDTLATDTEDWPRLAEVLARRAEVARPAEQKVLLARLGALTTGALARPAAAAEVYARLLRIDSGSVPALMFFGRHLWAQDAHEESAGHYQRVLDRTDATPSRDRAEASVRLAEWAWWQGRKADVDKHLGRALAAEPDGAPITVLIEGLETVGRHEELVVLLERREEAEVDPSARQEMRRLRAGILEQMGASAQAVELYRGLLASQPDEVAVLGPLAEVLRREGRITELVPVLERLWRLAGDAEAEAVGLELASLLADRLGQSGRAEEVLRALVDRLPAAPAPLEALSALLAAGGAPAQEEADALLLRRMDLPGDPSRVPLLAARAADLLRLGRRPALAPARASALLEELLAAGAAAPETLAEALAEVQGRIAEPKERLRALAQLLERGLPLAPETRGRIHVALAREAERDGDLRRAFDHFQLALDQSCPPAERAEQLVGRARVRFQQREGEEALADLTEALVLAPGHAPALAMHADLAFRKQDWEAARDSYARLAGAPDVALAIAPHLLASRRAVLAERLGDAAAAEAAYLEAADLEAGDAEAREALGAMALERGDQSEAARRFEEVLRLLPATPHSREVRRRLAAIYSQLQDFPAARRALEQALAEEPDRQDTLEALLAIYERDGLDREAAGVYERLARVYQEPEARARAHFRQGETLRERVGDLAAAGDAYLRALDLDPTDVPTLTRVVEHHWARGDFAGVAEIGAELLERMGPSDDTEERELVVAVAATIADPRSPAADRLDRWAPRRQAPPHAWLPGALDHALVLGPLRRVLRAMARALAGFAPIAPDDRLAGLGLPIETPKHLEQLRARLDGPDFRVVLRTDVVGAAALGTRPVTLAIRPDVAALGAAEIGFLATRALEEARAGTFVVRALDQARLRDLLRALAAVLGAAPGGDPALAGWLADPETAALLPQGSARTQLLSDLQDALVRPLDRESFLRGCRFTADRVAVLACASLPAALRAMAAGDGGEIDAGPVRELVGFLLSAEYRALVA